jgi:hypothetical protein
MHDATLEPRWGEITLAFVEQQIRSGLSVPVELGGGPIGTPDEPSIASVALLRPAAITHHTDAGARYIRLAITARGGGQLVARAPGSTNVAPPGWYMLFVVANNGLPSVGRFIQIQ